MSIKHNLSLSLFNNSNINVKTLDNQQPKNLLINDVTMSGSGCKSLNITADQMFCVTVTDLNERIICLIFSSLMHLNKNKGSWEL